MPFPKLCGRQLLSLVLTCLFVTVVDVRADYRFLGNVEAAQPGGSGIVLECADSVKLRVQFLLPEMFRLTLERPNESEPLLEYPLARIAWQPVEVDVLPDSARIILRTAALELEIRRAPCRLTVRDLAGHVLCEDDTSMGIGWDGPDVRVWKTITPAERFYGLGLKSGGVNKRGREWQMWNSDIPGYTDNTDPLYQSIPFVIGLRDTLAYGIYLNNSYRSRFNLGAGNLRYYSFSAEGGRLDYFFIAGPRMADVVARYTELTGRISLPPLWALGYQQSRWSYFPESEVLRLAETFREKRIPADVLYLDIHYMQGYRVFTFDRERFPDPRGMFSRLDRLGFKVVPIIDPGVKADSQYAVAREGLAAGHFVRYPDSSVYVGEVWPGPSYFPDFSRDSTRLWWGANVSRLRELGVAGFWNDMNEPAVWGQAFPTETRFDGDGQSGSHKRFHNLYGFLMARATHEGLLRKRPNERPFILTRAGFAGEQRYTAAWTGDNVASDEHLELGIRMILGMGLSGMPFVGTDIGGFMGTPSKELFARWIEVGALSPFCRAHTHYASPDQEPWSFGEEVEAISRRYLTLRYRLLPYLYSLFYEASQTGAPLWRPLFWRDGADPKVHDWAFQHQFYVGDYLLAAPVTRASDYHKRVYLPAGQWLDWETDSLHTGPVTLTVDAPLDRLPLFLRAGGIIPLRDSIQYTGEKPIQELTLDIFPSADSSRFDLYEDDGKTFDAERDIYRLTRFACQRIHEDITFTSQRLHNAYRLNDRALVLRFHGVMQPPAAVEVDGRTLHSKDERKASSSYDAATHTLTLRLRDRDAALRVFILAASPAPGQ